MFPLYYHHEIFWSYYQLVHYWWSYILFAPKCKELTCMLVPLLYRWGVPPVVIRCVHWTMQRGVLQICITSQNPVIVMFVPPMAVLWETKFLGYSLHSPRSIFYSLSSKCTHIGERASISFPHCNGDLVSFIVAQGRQKGCSPSVKGYYSHTRYMHTRCTWQLLYLTHCGLVTPYGDRDLGQLWLR